MPEPPDVEVFKQYSNSISLNKKISKVDIGDDSLLGDVSLHSLQM